ncbi:hypothetical protein RF679_15865 [Undibacterium cyanobacteriorum]|uniref:Uncharacterized protein n=1 Tax=Undibacterium cyanobacteriorum TaxID=3073561 RepID=A0ABY9RFV2_9BURK|nr:hypothetical protein [Undibacterium sp. 20NA77.5]WMW80108.1 hypothetical protein RF679_15865 [Undibacterium sp. 20NA77.5]
MLNADKDIRNSQTTTSDQPKPIEIQNWALSAFAGAVMAISKAETLPQLLRGICEAITTNTPFMLAWIGFANQGETKSVSVLGSAGAAELYLEDAHINWDENSPFGQGPTGKCMREHAHSNPIRFDDRRPLSALAGKSFTLRPAL